MAALRSVLFPWIFNQKMTSKNKLFTTGARCVIAAALLLVVTTSGCGRENWGYVTGTVKVDGEPAGPGSIMFEPVDPYTPTAFANPSQRAHALSQELLTLVSQRRAQDPALGVPDSLVALELAKASLLSQSGVAGAPQRMVVLALAAAALIAGVAVFLTGP